MSVHQSFQQWIAAPIQGAIPQSPQPDWHKEFIYDALSIALPSLQAAHDVAAAMSLNTSHYDLYTAICDALNACNCALERVNDSPDDTPYDVATLGQPIKGKVHALPSAFGAINVTNDPDFEF